MKKTNKCNMCGQHQYIEVSEGVLITIEEFTDLNIKSWPSIKAKVELLDEAVSKLSMVLGFLNHCKDELSHRGETQLHRDWIEKVLSKAKELK